MNVIPLPLVLLVPNGSVHLCAGTQVLLSSSTGANYSYSWFKNNFALSGFNSAQLSVADSGYYAVQVTSNGCAALSDSVVVSQNQIIAASIMGSDTVKICPGSTALFSAVTAPLLNYQWYLNAVAIPFASDSVYQTSISGNYSLMVSDAFCAATSTQKTLLQFATTSVSVSSFNAVCSNDSAFALSGGIPIGGNYSGSGIDSNYFHPNLAGTGFNSVNYTYIDSNLCAVSASSVIEVKALAVTPLISQNFNELNSSSAYGNQW